MSEKIHGYLDREGYIRRQIEKGRSREDVEAELKQREMGMVTASLGYETHMEAEMQRRKSIFINDFLEVKRAEDPKNLEVNREKLAKQGAELWETFQAGKRKYRELEEQSHVKPMKWKTLEKPLRQWLENEGTGRGWRKEMVENTVKARRLDFETAQHRVRERLKSAAYNPEEDFKKRMLNPKQGRQRSGIISTTAPRSPTG